MGPLSFELVLINHHHHRHHHPDHHHLGGIVHDLIRELRLCDVFPQLLDPSAARLWGAVLVNHLQNVELDQVHLAWRTQ